MDRLIARLLPLVALAVVSCASVSLPSAPADNAQVLPAGSGNIQGFVYLDEGEPLRGAEVVVFGNWNNNSYQFNQATITGDPGEAPTMPTPPDNTTIGTPVTVLHDFGDGRGQVLAQRIVRMHPIAEGDGRFIFLRPGEYFFDGVPNSIMTIQASYDPNPDKAPVDFKHGIKPMIRPEIRVQVEAAQTVFGANIVVMP